MQRKKERKRSAINDVRRISLEFFYLHPHFMQQKNLGQLFPTHSAQTSFMDGPEGWEGGVQTAE